MLVLVQRKKTPAKKKPDSPSLIKGTPFQVADIISLLPSTAIVTKHKHPRSSGKMFSDIAQESGNGEPVRAGRGGAPDAIGCPTMFGITQAGTSRISDTWSFGIRHHHGIRDDLVTPIYENLWRYQMTHGTFQIMTSLEDRSPKRKSTRIGRGIEAAVQRAVVLRPLPRISHCPCRRCHWSVPPIPRF